MPSRRSLRSSFAQDPVKVAPNEVKVVLENDYVRVLSWTENPGDKTPTHEHPALVSVSFSDAYVEGLSPRSAASSCASEVTGTGWTAGPRANGARLNRSRR
jgi:beta-alanine degradation protein BauB